MKQLYLIIYCTRELVSASHPIIVKVLFFSWVYVTQGQLKFNGGFEWFCGLQSINRSFYVYLPYKQWITTTDVRLNVSTVYYNTGCPMWTWVICTTEHIS